MFKVLVVEIGLNILNWVPISDELFVVLKRVVDVVDERLGKVQRLWTPFSLPWGGKYDEPSGFGTSKVSSQALSYANKVGRLDESAERFGDVVVENLD